MASSAEALDTIRSLIQEHGSPMPLSDVLGPDQSAETAPGIQVAEEVSLYSSSPELVPANNSVGTFVCQALLVPAAETGEVATPTEPDLVIRA